MLTFLTKNVKEIQNLSQCAINTQGNVVSVHMISKTKGQDLMSTFMSQRCLFL